MLDRLQNRHRFIREIADGKLDLLASPRPKKDTVAMLRKAGYSPESPTGATASPDPDESMGDFNYLLSTPIDSFTHEQVSKLEGEMTSSHTRLETLQGTPPLVPYISQVSPHLLFYGVVSVPRCVPPCKHLTILKTVSTLMTLC